MNDLKFAFRTLLKNPGFSAIAILTLGLGIGVNAAMFSILDGILLRGLPSPEEHRLLGAYYTEPAGSEDERLGFSQLEFHDLQARQQSFEDLAAYEVRTTTVCAPAADPERISGTAISSAGPAMLRAPLALGRWFNAGEEKPGAPPTVVLGHALWQNRFRADSAIVGTAIKLDSEWATVVGVAASGFGFPDQSEAWYPPRALHLNEKRDNRPYRIFGRLKPGVTSAQARAEWIALCQRGALDHPEAGKALVPRLTSMIDSLQDNYTKVLLWVMLTAVLFVLLIACTNVANLLLARATTRQKEMAVRTALGASQTRIVRLSLAESLLLALGGCALGLVVAQLGLAAFRGYLTNLKPPYWLVIQLDGPALLYTAGLTIAACLLAGLYPALRLSRPDLSTALNDAARGSTGRGLARFTRAMVIGEVALSSLLLVLSALMIRSVVKMNTAPLGFTSAGVYTGRVALPSSQYKDVAQQRAFFLQLQERLRSTPEIAKFSLCDLDPTWSGQDAVAIDGAAPVAKDQRGPLASLRAVSPGYFATLSIPLLRGRDVEDADTATSPHVTLVSVAFSEKHWPGENPLGKRLRRVTNVPGETIDWLTVVGVVASTMQGRFDQTTPPQVYVPFTQYYDIQRMSIFATGRGGDVATMAPVLRSIVRGLNEDLPLYFAQTLDLTIAEAKFNRKLIAGLFAVFGVVAFVLSAVGLYGVMSYTVGQRRQEIGVRMALGATSRDVMKLLFRQGGRQVAIGLAIGMTLALAAGQVLTTVLYGITAGDPVSFGATALSLGAAGAVATLIPALRAVRIDPMMALRAD